MKKSYKKRSRKRSTKKRARRARRRTRKAGEYSKLAKDLLRSKTERKIGIARQSKPVIEYFQKKPFGNADADLADNLAVELKRAQGQAVGMQAVREEAKRKMRQLRQRERAQRERENTPSNTSITLNSTLGKRKRGGKRKRKTRRRRRR